MQFKPLAAVLSVVLVVILAQTSFSSCSEKTNIDTLVIRDTIKEPAECNCDVNTLKYGLVAYYNFNAGSLKDSSGIGNHITFNNAVPTSDRFGKPDNAYLFNGTSSYMRITNNPSLNPEQITIMATVKFTSFYDGNCHATDVIKKGYDSDKTLGIYGLRAHEHNSLCSQPLNPNRQSVFGFYGDTHDNWAAPSDLTTFAKTNEWRTYVFTYDKKNARLFIDGVLSKEEQKVVPFTPNSNDIFIGKGEAALFPYWFGGVIDEVRIYNRALCADEVKLLQQRTN